MKFLNITIIIFILIISVGVVSAQDNATDDLNMNETAEITQDEILSAENQAGTLIDLQNDIEAATDSIEITRDYEYNQETDKQISRVLINKQSFIINGNNHVIDARQHGPFCSSGRNQFNY